MEYQKIANMLNNESNKPSKFSTRNWDEINDESRGTYTGNDIKFKTTMLRSNLCDYADAYILVKGTITITGAGDDDAAKRLDERNKGVIFKNCAPFTKCISRINSTQYNAQYIDNGWSVYFFAVEVGASGYCLTSLKSCLLCLGLPGKLV